MDIHAYNMQVAVHCSHVFRRSAEDTRPQITLEQRHETPISFDEIERYRAVVNAARAHMNTCWGKPLTPTEIELQSALHALKPHGAKP